VKNIENLNTGDVAVVGIPSDANSSFMRGPALAPARIRQVLLAGSANMTTELGLDLDQHDGWGFAGDLAISVPDADAQIESGIAELLDRGLRVVSLGGDHSVTFPIMRAVSRRHPNLTLIQLDAHPDLYDELDGNRLSHACPFARIMEAGLVKRLVQIGIRTLNQHQREQADRFGVEIITASAWPGSRILRAAAAQPDAEGTGSIAVPQLSGPIYLSLDLDVLDPAYAPGVSHHEPGGLSSRDVLDLIQALPGPIIGADIVELNPHRDLVDMTAMVAAKCLKEILGRMLG
jgi:arginase